MTKPASDDQITEANIWSLARVQIYYKIIMAHPFEDNRIGFFKIVHDAMYDDMMLRLSRVLDKNIQQQVTIEY